MRNKRGAAIAVNTIIFLVLGLAVLLLLILGFTLGWGKLLPFLSSENVETIVNGCSTACITGAKYGYCSQVRTLVDGDDNEFSYSCKQFATNESLKIYGINDCSSIDCS